MSSEENFRYSESVFGNFICSWTIKNFIYRYKMFTSSTRCFSCAVDGEEITSMDIYPDGYDSSDRGFVSFSLKTNTSSAAPYVNLNLAVTLENTKGYRICKSRNEFKKCSSKFTIFKMIERKDLLLHDDILVCRVEVTHSSATYNPNRTAKTRRPDLRTHVGLAADMRQLLKTGKGSDATISVSSTSIPVHSVILSARSKVFAAMFEHDTTEKTTRCVSITDFKIDSIMALLEFVYCGDFQGLNFELALDLVRAADKYDVEDLKLYCENFLFTYVKMKNIGQILFVADMCNAPRLRNYAIQYFYEQRQFLDFDKLQILKDRNALLWDLLVLTIKQ